MLDQGGQKPFARSNGGNAQYQVLVAAKLCGHMLEPLVAAGNTVHIGKEEVLKLCFFDRQCEGQFFTAHFHEISIQRNYFQFGMQLLLLNQKQRGVIGAAVVGYNDFKIGVILGEPLRKVLFQFGFGVSAGDNDANTGGVAVDRLNFGTIDFEEITK